MYADNVKYFYFVDMLVISHLYSEKDKIFVPITKYKMRITDHNKNIQELSEIIDV